MLKCLKRHLSRRDFFTRLGWGGFGIFSALGLLGFIRSAFAGVLFQPPSSVKGGSPSDYAIGEVSEKCGQEFPVWIMGEEDGFYVIFAKCTHVGCRSRWLPAENKFKCSCHGKRFLYVRTGTTSRGRRPRPLDRFKIALTPAGKLVVDKSKVFKMEAGVFPDEQYPRTF